MQNNLNAEPWWAFEMGITAEEWEEYLSDMDEIRRLEEHGIEIACY